MVRRLNMREISGWVLGGGIPIYQVRYGNGHEDNILSFFVNEPVIVL